MRGTNVSLSLRHPGFAGRTAASWRTRWSEASWTSAQLSSRHRQQELVTCPHSPHRPPSQSHHPGRKRRLVLCESVLRRGPAHGHAPAMGPARAQKATHHSRCTCAATPHCASSPVVNPSAACVWGCIQGGVGEFERSLCTKIGKSRDHKGVAIYSSAPQCERNVPPRGPFLRSDSKDFETKNRSSKGFVRSA
jgi:hypothetical protein